MAEKSYEKLNLTLIYNLKKKIEELKTSENKFRTIFENANDGILIADAKTKDLVFANPRICKLTGYTEKELLQLSVADIHPKKDLPYVINQFTKQLQRKIEIAENLPVLKKDKSVVYCDINASGINIDGKELLVGFFRDITEKKEAGEKIKESEEKYRAIVENAADQIFVLDKDFKIISMNKTAASLSGKTPDELTGVSIFRIFPKKIAVQFSKNIKEVFETGKSKFIEEKMIAKNLEFYNSTQLNPIKNNEGKVTAVVGIVRDITEKKKAEKSLKKSEEKYRNIVDNIGDPLFIYDKDGNCLFANKTVVNQAGINVDEVKDNLLKDVFPKKVLDYQKKVVRNVFKTGKQFNVEGVFPIKGVHRWCQVSIWPIKDKSGKVVAAQGIARDITLFKENEENLQKQIDDLKKTR